MIRHEQKERNAMMKKILLIGLLVLSPMWAGWLEAAEETGVAPSETAEPTGGETLPETAESTDVIDTWQGRVTLGGAAVRLDRESFKFAEYDRIPDDGFYAVGEADLHYQRRDYHFDFRGEGLGLQNRHLSLGSGRYGRYEILLDYDQFVKRNSNTSLTPFDGAGGINLTLPSGFVTGANSQSLTTLQSSLKEVDLVLKRKRATSGLSYVLGPILLDLSLMREYKEGIGSIGGVVGTNGGTGRSIVLPEPVDHITDDLRAAVSYSGEVSQIALEYHYSQFNNREESLSWDNPFNVTVGGADPYQSPLPSNGFQARLQLPPDNLAHDISLSGGLNLPYRTRISARVGYGQMKQNEALLPFSTSTDTSLLPRQTAAAEIDTALLWLNVASRPLQRLSLDAQYKDFRTKNKTPRDLFRYVKTDNTLGTQAAITAEHALYNLPYDWTQSLMKLDASYYLMTGTTLKLGYDRDTVGRDYREIRKTRENTYRAGFRSTYFSKAHAGVNVSAGRRKGLDDYNHANIYSEIHTPEHIAAISNPDLRFENHPELRKFDIADRRRYKYGANLTTFPHETTTVGLSYNFTGDEYDPSKIGLQDRDDRSVTVDVSVAPFEALSVHGFYTIQEIDFRQVGRNFGSVVAQVQDPNRNWRIDHDDDTDTMGTGFNLSMMDHRVTINGTYSFSVSNIATDIEAGPALTPPAVDLPDLKTRLHSVELSGQYRVTEQLSVGIGYQYEIYKSEDFATAGVDPGSSVIAAVVTLSGSVPNYRAQVGMVYATMEF